MNQVDVEQTDLILEIEQSVTDCRILENTEEINACIAELLPTFYEKFDNIVQQVIAIHDLGQEAVNLSQESIFEFYENNRQLVRESSQITREELTNCIENL